MADILIRGLDDEVVKRLKERARIAGRSLESEAKLILEHAANHSVEESLRIADEWRRRVSKPTTDCVELLREDRTR